MIDKSSRPQSVDRVLPFSASFVEETGRGPVLVTAGDLDVAAAPALVSVVEAQRPLRGLTIDAAELSFVDSAGLRALLTVRQMAEADAGSTVRLRNVSASLRQLLEICGLTDAFDAVTED